MKKYTEKELDKLLDELRFYLPYGIYRIPVEARKASGLGKR